MKLLDCEDYRSTNNTVYMFKFFKFRYKVAIYHENSNIISWILFKLKRWYKYKIKIKSYTDYKVMFSEINMAKAKNSPFDVIILGPDEYEALAILKNCQPNTDVIMFTNEAELKSKTYKFNRYSLFSRYILHNKL